jgi:hypothetical protein
VTEHGTPVVSLRSTNEQRAVAQSHVQQASVTEAHVQHASTQKNKLKFESVGWRVFFLFFFFLISGHLPKARFATSSLGLATSLS